ncbi:MAG: hypothetical protein GEV28_26455 [Actinophytocola sp.]|uniref:hypothetical protein n=1 Tax=Actinophytocola sp. TaxID=1872138 RepID=UPI00132A5FC5|nr:hypothetical protein [Actinophytocola sp.]MPZ83742.1 hypothetical protein [Actinophytocola sp.]
MAHTSTARRRFGAALSAVGVGVAATAVLVGMAGTASAHTPKVKADCTENGTSLTVKLVSYNDQKDNTVKITDGDTVVDEATFGESYDFAKDDFDNTVQHEFTVEVKAWDDPKGKEGWSFTKSKTVEACVEAPPEETTTTPPPPAESSEAPPAPPASAPETTTSTEVEEAALAETGASVALPLGIGAVLLVGGGVLLFVVRRHGRA